MTDHCIVGGQETDDPFAADFWTAAGPTRGIGAPYTNTDPGSRTAGVST